jgi:hypothetical protein
MNDEQKPPDSSFIILPSALAVMRNGSGTTRFGI